MKLPSSSTWLFVSALLNSAEAVTLALFQMTSVLTKGDSEIRMYRGGDTIVQLC